MKTSRYTEPQILAILRQAEGGMPVAELCRAHGMSNASFYKWRAKYGGMDASMITQTKALEDENRRLKKMFAELSMQNELLKEALGKKRSALHCPEGKCAHLPWVNAARWPGLRWRDLGSARPVIAMARSCGPRPRRSPIFLSDWGDIMTQYAGLRGIAGTVIDGVCRDVMRTLGDGYPLFTAGRFMRTGKDRVQVNAAGGTVARQIESVEQAIRDRIGTGQTLRAVRNDLAYHLLQR